MTVQAESGAPLRLLAEDADDLRIISAALQDAVAKVGNIHWEQKARSLTIEFNRFRWEREGQAAGQRVRAGLQLGDVQSVKARGLNREAKNTVIELLAIDFTPGDPPGGVVTLAFAGGADLRVEVECLDVVLADLSEPWPTRRTPRHDAGDLSA